MALLKVHTVAELAILLNYCMALFAVDLHPRGTSLSLKRSLKMLWISFAHEIGTGIFVPPFPFSSSLTSPIALRSLLLRLFYIVTETPGQCTFPHTQHALNPMNSHVVIHLLCLCSCDLLVLLASEALNCAQE